MVTHRRRRTVLTALALYTLAALFIGYFAVNAFTGNRGLRAAQDIGQQRTEVKAERSHPKAEDRRRGHRVSLLRSDRIDPDMLDERVRAMLDYVDPKEIVMLTPPR